MQLSEKITLLRKRRGLSQEQLANELKEYGNQPIYLVGDGYENAKNVLAELGVKTENTPELLLNENAFSLCMLAYRKYKAGEYTTDTAITPTYLRMPQAERERLEKIKNN